MLKMPQSGGSVGRVRSYGRFWLAASSPANRFPKALVVYTPPEDVAKARQIVKDIGYEAEFAKNIKEAIDKGPCDPPTMNC